MWSHVISWLAMVTIHFSLLYFIHVTISYWFKQNDILKKTVYKVIWKLALTRKFVLSDGCHCMPNYDSFFCLVSNTVHMKALFVIYSLNVGFVVITLSFPLIFSLWSFDYILSSKLVNIGYLVLHFSLSRFTLFFWVDMFTTIMRPLRRMQKENCRK